MAEKIAWFLHGTGPAGTIWTAEDPTNSFASRTQAARPASTCPVALAATVPPADTDPAHLVQV